MKTVNRILLGIIVGICITAAFAFQAYGRDQNGDIVIIVDPGHGGNDGGSASSYDKESDLNWRIAMALKAELQTYEGVRVYLTRGSAEWNSNTARGRMGAELGADLFVSVHNNSSASGTASGVEVYGTVNAGYKDQIRTLCDMVAKRVSALGLANGGYRARPSTDDPSVDFYTMLDEAVKCNIPGLIIEHCYLSNASDAAFINSTENQIKCGIADATAIAEYYGLSKRGVAAGGEITLIRTYSACMTGASGTYSSSDESVAYVSPEGVITAVGEGSAVITCTDADGEKKSVTVKVPAVAMTGIAAGINPTFYSDPSAAAAYNQSTVMVKAIYNDGHVEQLSGGFALGAFPSSENGIFDVPVSYNGFNCPLRIYGIGGYLGNYNVNNYKVIGTNADILLFPPVYNGINTGIKITTGGSMQASAPVVTPTEPPAPPVETPAPSAEPPVQQPEETTSQIPEPTEALTEAVTTSAETAGNTEEATTPYESEAQTKENETGTKEEISSAASDSTDGENLAGIGAVSSPKEHTVWFYVMIVCGIIAGAAAIACITMLLVGHFRKRK